MQNPARRSSRVAPKTVFGIAVGAEVSLLRGGRAPAGDRPPIRCPELCAVRPPAGTYDASAEPTIFSVRRFFAAGRECGGRTGRFPSGLGRMVGRPFRTRPSASFPPSERRPPDGSSALREHGLRLENAAGGARTPDVLRLSGILRRAVGHFRLSKDIYPDWAAKRV